VELLLPALSPHHPRRRGHRLPRSFAAKSAGPAAGVWDGLPAHRGRAVKEFIAAQRGRLVVEQLPASAPELNPVEYIWGYWKHHQLPNFCPQDFAQLSHHARRALRRMRRRTPLVRSFWHQAQLSL
jgi:transposase